MTLQPRVVELARSHNAAFRALVNNLPVLEVCRDSRAAVIQLYPLSFGTFWYPPPTCFNSDMDTIYLDYDIAKELAFFFTFLSQFELSRIRYFALDMSLFIDERYFSSGYDGIYQETSLRGLESVVNVLIGLEQLIEVHNIHVWREHCRWLPEKDSPHSREGGQNKFYKGKSHCSRFVGTFQDLGIKNHKVVFGMRKKWTVKPEGVKATSRYFHRTLR